MDRILRRSWEERYVLRDISTSRGWLDADDPGQLRRKWGIAFADVRLERSVLLG
jgi:hypothetical protein